MKNLLFGFIMLCIMIGTPILGWGGIANSEHDFSGKPWVNKKSACVVCHSLESGRSKNSNDMTWTHELSSANYFTYSSQTLKSSLRQPEGVSLFCLSCHDGTVAIDAYGGRHGSEKTRKTLGTDLSKIHPVSFIYNDALAVMSGHLKRPSKSPSGLGGSIEEDLLKKGKMECTSCHDTHNRFYEENMLIRRDRGGSMGLCGICHTSVPPGEIKMGHWE
ncbi:MAG: cytochrome c3 family protein [Chlamydiota bacterium]|nr:cytochrome c3 family protein [Chlamydiota bacterium]